MLNRVAAAVIAAFFATGCALVWTSQDDSSQKAKKLAGRIPLAIVTLGISEVVISREYDRDRQFQLERDRKAERVELVRRAQEWQERAVATKDVKDRELFLRFYDSTQQQIADLDAKMAAAVGAK